MSKSRIIPSIEQLLQRSGVQVLLQTYGRTATVNALRAAAEKLRTELEGPSSSNRVRVEVLEAAEHLESEAAKHLTRSFMSSLQPVINATGVIIHTNLGRAPLADSAVKAIATIAPHFTNLEYDVESGGRGQRDTHVQYWLRELTGAEAVVVVNNNAAATLLLLSALASGREVIVSRGELVEIGGGFRVPDVLAQSGAQLREIGTTNRTRADDYAAAINDRTGLLLRVHPSNFRIEGFAERPSLESLVGVGQRFGVPVVEDLGSGYLVSHDELPEEPTVRASVEAGVDVICFSGDKLLGGPQAGVIVGRDQLLQRVRTHPLMRAVRADKLTYAAMDATLREYAFGRAPDTVPVIRMIKAQKDEIERRARVVAAAIATSTIEVQIIDGVSTIGGGSAPGSELSTRLLAMKSSTIQPKDLAATLRCLTPPVIGRIEQGQVVLDLRTVLPEQDEMLARALGSLTA